MSSRCDETIRIRVLRARSRSVCSPASPIGACAMHMLTVAARVQMTPGRVKRALLLSMTLAAMPVEAPAAAA